MEILTFLLPVSLLLGTHRIPHLPVPIYATHLVMLAIIAWALWQLGPKGLIKAWQKIAPSYQIAFILIGIGFLIGGLRATSLSEGLAAFVAWGLLPALTALSLYAWQLADPSAKLRDRVRQGVIFFATAQTLIGFYQVWTDAAVEGRLSGLFASPNGYAAAVVPAIALALEEVFSRKSAWARGALPVMVVGIMLSRSLGGLLAVAAILSLVAWRMLSKKWRMIAAAGALMLLLIGGAIAHDRFNREGNSAQSRGQIWRTAVSVIGDNPISGTGLRSFAPFYQTRVKEIYPRPFEVVETSVPEPHNILLAWWLDTGLFGLLGFIMIHALLLKHFKTALWAVLPLVAFLVHGLVDTPFFLLELAILWWMYIFLAYTAIKPKS